MSIESVLTRIAQIDTAFAPKPPPQQTAQTTSSGGNTFAGMLQSAAGPGTVGATAGAMAPMGVTADGSVGAKIVAAAQGEVGQREINGSNDSPRIAQYRAATAGNPGPGPWCAYFVSWAARQAGSPLGAQGQGFGSVDALYSWAQQAGRAQPTGSGYVPKPGDLIVFHEHIGIVEGVLPNGTIQTIEGNSSDQVSRRTHPRGDAVGFVRMG